MTPRHRSTILTKAAIGAKAKVGWSYLHKTVDFNQSSSLSFTAVLHPNFIAVYLPLKIFIVFHCCSEHQFHCRVSAIINLCVAATLAVIISRDIWQMRVQ